MKIKRTLLVAIILITLSTIGAGKPVIVGYNGNFDSIAIDEYGITNFTLYEHVKAFSSDIPETVIADMEEDDKIRYIEEDSSICIEKKVVSPSQMIDWGITTINAPCAWKNTTGEGIRIAVIDTGIDKKHPDLNVVGGVNLIDSSNIKKWNDDNGHGTHIAGIIAACNNSIGVVGVAYDSELYAVKVLDRSGFGQISDVIEGIEWAIENDMNIISMSIGTTEYSQALEEACDLAYSSDILLVAAAGNSGDGNNITNNVEYPGKFDSVIAVSAIDNDNNIVSWSSDGEEVELAAPGVDIYSTYLDSDYATFSGTSMATPFVSGVAALLMSEDPSLSAQEVRDRLCSGAIDLGDPGMDGFFGNGLLSA